MPSASFVSSLPTAPRRGSLALVILALLAPGLSAQSPATDTGSAGDGVVRAVYFFSPTCPACRDLAQRDLPPILAEWGSSLELLRVDVSTPAGSTLYQAAMRKWLVARERFGVPALFVGRRHLVGTVEIPAQLPGIVEAGVARGGLDWPEIPGLDGVVSGGAGAQAGLSGEDPLGMALGFGVLLALLGALGWSGLKAVRGKLSGPPPRGDPWILGWCGVGMAVAGYLSWVSVQGGEVLCGPVGSCSLVHASSFGTLAGIPVALLGLAFFAGVALLAWAPETPSVRAALGVAAWGGPAFSVYLTATELFVIGAVCTWCLASALVTAALLIRISGAGSPAGAETSRRRVQGHGAARGAHG